MSEPFTITELVIPGSDNSIQTECHRLSYKERAIFDIFVDRFDQDEVSAAIRDHSYRFAPAFDLLPALTSLGGRVLDLGAHIGTFSLLAAKLGYQVTAVEASPRNAAILQAGIQRNHFDNLNLLAIAVSDRDETLEFIQAGPYGLVATPLLNDPTITVSAMSVDHILTHLGWPTVDFVKMDVEGSEVKAIAGAQELLSHPNAPAILYESNGHTLHYFSQTPNDLMAALEKCGYSCYLIASGQLIPLRSNEPLFLCTIDCLATKTPPASVKGWRLRVPFTHDEQIALILATAGDGHPHPRAYIARALRSADLELIADARVSAVLKQLINDTDPDVRADAAWFETDDFQRALAAKKAEIAHRQNSFSRATQSIRRWWNRI